MQTRVSKPLHTLSSQDLLFNSAYQRLLRPRPILNPKAGPATPHPLSENATNNLLRCGSGYQYHFRPLSSCIRYRSQESSKPKTLFISKTRSNTLLPFPIRFSLPTPPYLATLWRQRSSFAQIPCQALIRHIVLWLIPPPE